MMARRMSTSLRPAALLGALVLALAGCGGGDSSKPSAADAAANRAQSESTAQPAAAAAEPQPPTAEKVTPTAGEASLAKKPTVPKGSGAAPTKLVAQDLADGSGPAVKTGDQLTVQYVGVLYKDGKEFDSSWGKQPFTFTVGQGVIDGWSQGVLGMKAGGRRKLIIPADLAYGAEGQPPEIGPNEPLIFDIDLKKIG
jgi:peptidylprolyl isomerase